MSLDGYVVEVTNLSPKATEKDVYNFFALCGKIEHIEIIRHSDIISTGYITFEHSHAMDMAVLLSGATLVDQQVCIARWGDYNDSSSLWAGYSWDHDQEANSSDAAQENYFTATQREAVTMVQEVVKTMLAKGYVLGKDALVKAKAFDESYGVSAAAAAKAFDLCKRIGLTDRINTGVDAVKSVDERYHVYETTRAAMVATGKGVAAATSAIVNSSYFSAGALLVSDALARASKAASDLANHGNRN